MKIHALFGRTAITLAVLAWNVGVAVGESDSAVKESDIAASSQSDYVQSLVDQNFILRSVGDHETVKLKKNQLGHISGSCDIAVQVSKADWKIGAIHLLIQVIGSPSVPGRPRGVCSGKYTDKVEISGFSADEPPDSLSAALGAILQTPEQYLRGLGIPFDLPAQSDDEIHASVAYKVAPKVLLKVDPFSTGTARIEGDASFGLVVGTDGRAHRPRVLVALGSGLEGNALRAVSMYRFEPARQLDKPVSITATIRVSIRLF